MERRGEMAEEGYGKKEAREERGDGWTDNGTARTK